ncbi:hypothetical protein MMC22_001079 [Lobaria immixta]|nr:hypothetical protein [Lobaria immixta]
MATHSLAIAKASLAAGLMRPDPTSAVPHTEISQLHTLLETLLRRCSPGNIQLCKDWLLRNTLPSAARTTVFGKYLVALSVSLGNSEDEKISRSDKQTRPSTRRKQLHILYLLNDLLHHTKYHLESSSIHSILTANIQSHLISLIGTTSAYDPGTFGKHHHKIQDLLNIWVEKCYFDPLYIQTLRGTVDQSLKNGPAGPGLVSSRLQTSVEKTFDEHKADDPFIMPLAHGDTSTPYYDLPAGNMMPHIIPNSTIPINPQILRPLQFMGGPAEETLVSALKDFMKEIGPNVKTGRDDEILPDTDELGNVVMRDLTTGEFIGGEGITGPIMLLGQLGETEASTEAPVLANEGDTVTRRAAEIGTELDRDPGRHRGQVQRKSGELRSTAPEKGHPQVQEAYPEPNIFPGIPSTTSPMRDPSQDRDQFQNQNPTHHRQIHLNSDLIYLERP